MIDSTTIKQLREKTGAGMNDCQKALDEAGGNFDVAVEIIRKKGLEKAGKKAERSTKEGLVALAREGNKVAVVAIACETDFVARNEGFIQAVDEFAKKLLVTEPAEFKTWAEEKITQELIVRIGENMKLAEFGVIQGEVLGVYLHSNKKLATVVTLADGNEIMANDIAMQIAAMSPKYLAPADVPAEEVAKEKEIYSEQLKNEGKPEAVIEKILAGKLNKYYSEVCLLKQPFIKDDKMTIEQLLESAGGEAKITGFHHYQI